MTEAIPDNQSLDSSLEKLTLEEPVDSTFEKLKSFCEKHDIPTTGAIAFTMSRNRTGEYASLIVDMEERTFHELYPKPFNQVFKEGPVSEDQQFLYCYQSNLDPNPLREMKATSAASEPNEVDAFCCASLEPYRPRRTH